MCELPYGKVASDSVGGAGGTCVLRGCVPKKLMVFGGEFSEAFRDSVAFGCDRVISFCICVPGLTGVLLIVILRCHIHDGEACRNCSCAIRVQEIKILVTKKPRT